MIGVELFLTPAGTARSEDPGLSAAREAAGDVPAGKQKRRSGNQWYIRFSIFPPTNILLIRDKKGLSTISPIETTLLSFFIV